MAVYPNRRAPTDSADEPLSILLIYSSCFAAVLPKWNIDGVLFAPSPGQFKLEANKYLEGKTLVSYNYTDESDIVYNTSYLGPYYLHESEDVFGYLEWVLKGSSQGINGRIFDKTRVRLDDGANGILYKIEYYINDYKVRKYGIFFYGNSKICHWAVQEIVGVSRKSAKDLFYNNLRGVSLVSLKNR